MKHIINLITALCVLAGSISASGIYGNGTGSEDSISVSVHITDSLGNPSGTHADSFFVSIIGPGGDSIIAHAGVASTAGLDIDSIDTPCPGWKYIYSQAVNEIDGQGRPGTYELTFCAKDNSPEYINCSRTTFQVIGTHLDSQLANISTILDSLLATLDTLQNHDDWVSSFDPAEDTALSDIVRISGDAQAADNFESMLDGSGGHRLFLSGLNIQALDNDTAVIVKASGTGIGLGMYILGGGNGGEGIKIIGGNTKSALVAEGGSTIGSTHGIDLTGQGSGFGLNGTFSTSCMMDIADRIWDEDTTGHGMSGSFAYMLKDTAAYQGSASGLTAAEVADSVWNHILDSQWESGTFGDSAADWGASSAFDGDGIYPVAISSWDSANDQAVPGVRIAVHNIDLSAMMAIRSTSPEGKAAFNLDSGSYIISAYAPGYIFDACDTIEVDGAEIDTVLGTRFDPGSPALPGLCRVYGYLYGIDGLPMEGATISAQLTDGSVRHGSTIISPYKRSAVSDSIGYFQIDLIPSDLLIPANTPYLVSLTYPSGTILKKSITIPEESSWLLDW